MLQKGAKSTEVVDALQRVYARPEFADDERTLLEEFLEWLGETFDFEAAAGPVGSVVTGLFDFLLIALAVALIWLVVRFTLEYLRSRTARRVAALSPELLIRTRVQELYAAAQRARREGNYKLAVQYGLFALVTGLGARGAFEYRDAWTYREILRNGEPDAATSELLGGLVGDLEAKEFGDEPISEGDLDRLDELCAQHLSGFLEAAA